MEVDVLPAHGHLDATKFAKREVRRHSNVPPYHGTDPGQPEFDLQVRVGLRRRILFRNGASAVVIQAKLPPRTARPS